MRRGCHAQFQNGSRGFTLVELMVSVALVIVLMLAITQIFTITSKTIGGGQAIANGLRDAQAAQTVFAQDFSNVTPDGACMVIRNTRRAIPRNLTDEQKITSYVPESNILSEDLDGDGNNELYYPAGAPFQTYSPLGMNHRNHRMDFLMLCVRGIYPRQTGNPDTIVADMSAREAVIFYHHLHLPTDSGEFNPNTLPGHFDGTPPTQRSNPNNFFPNQWILGRTAMLLVEPDAAGNIYDRTLPQTAGSISDQNYYPVSRATSTQYYPFYDQSAPTVKYAADPDTTNTSLANARYDLMGMSMDGFKTKLKSVITGFPLHPWWNESMNQDDKRFKATPFVTQPVDAKKISQSAPIFLPACSQFVVEFAGDFVSQNWDPVLTDPAGPPGNVDPPDSALDRANAAYGQYIPGSGPDGRVDTVYAQTSATTGFYRGDIRWYGLPRDTNGDGFIRAMDGDVVPVRMISRVRQAFEKTSPTKNFPNPLTNPDNSAWVPVPWADYNNPAELGGNTLNTNPEYTVAWGPAEIANTSIGKPQMIRITIGLDRPEAEGKLPDGQVFEYVFKVGR